MHRKLRSPRRPYRLLVGLRTLMYDQLSRLAGSIACATCYVHVCNTYVRGKWSRLSIRASTISHWNVCPTLEQRDLIERSFRERGEERKRGKCRSDTVDRSKVVTNIKIPKNFDIFFSSIFLTSPILDDSLKLLWIVILNSSYLILFPMI